MPFKRDVKETSVARATRMNSHVQELKTIMEGALVGDVVISIALRRYSRGGSCTAVVGDRHRVGLGSVEASGGGVGAELARMCRMLRALTWSSERVSLPTAFQVFPVSLVAKHDGSLPGLLSGP